MTFSAYTVAVETFVPVLRNLSAHLDKGAAYAAAKNFDPSVLITARLAPDMFSLNTQVQIACYQALNAVALLTGQAPAPRPTGEDKTIDEMKARITKTISDIQSVSADKFKGAEDRDIKLPLRDTMTLEMKGGAFLRDWCFPNFYFHVVTAYDIMRNNGVDLGKQDFLAHIAGAIRQN